jgi:drug/metabolite transporter, DME family
VLDLNISTTLLPIVLSLVAAFLFALGAQFQNLGLAYMDSRRGAAITISTSAMLFLLAAPVFLEIEHLLNPAVLIFVLVGCFRPAISANFSLAGMRYLGPTLSSTLTSTAPFFGAALGVFWLGEDLTWPVAVGTLAIVFAIMLLSIKRGGVAASWPLWALAFPVGAAAIRSGAHVFTKIGMESVPDAYVAGLVGFVVSAIITLCIHKARRDAQPIAWRCRGTRWFMGASCCFSLAVISLNNALHVGQIIQVVPIVAASPVFTLMLSVLIFRREKITTRVIGSVFIVVSAVILIAVAG